MGARRPLVRVNGRIAALPAGDIIDKASVGLGNVDNTADANKPVSAAQQAALDLKVAKSNIVGIVSQASGLPTGAIIETGTNSNGTYTKFADGTMICRYRASFSAVMTSSFGAMYVTPTLPGYTYPAPFVSIPACVIYVEQAGTIAYLSSGGAGTATTTPAFQMSCPVSTTQNMILQYVAVGRWY